MGEENKLQSRYLLVGDGKRTPPMQVAKTPLQVRPDSPRSPTQKYRLTAKGERCLHAEARRTRRGEK